MPTKEEWVCHRYHEASHSAVAWLEGGSNAISAINQFIDHKRRLVGDSGVYWGRLENGSMACVAVAGALGEAKGFVYQSGHADAAIRYTDGLIGGINDLFQIINAGTKDEAWPLRVNVLPLVEKTKAVITIDDLRRISDNYKRRGRLKFVLQRTIDYLNRSDVETAVRALAEAIPEAAPRVLHRGEVRDILGHYLPDDPVPFAFWLEYEATH